MKSQVTVNLTELPPSIDPLDYGEIVAHTLATMVECPLHVWRAPNMVRQVFITTALPLPGIAFSLIDRHPEAPFFHTIRHSGMPIPPRKDPTDGQ